MRNLGKAIVSIAITFGIAQGEEYALGRFIHLPPSMACQDETHFTEGLHTLENYVSKIPVYGLDRGLSDYYNVNCR